MVWAPVVHAAKLLAGAWAAPASKAGFLAVAVLLPGVLGGAYALGTFDPVEPGPSLTSAAVLHDPGDAPSVDAAWLVPMPGDIQSMAPYLGGAPPAPSDAAPLLDVLDTWLARQGHRTPTPGLPEAIAASGLSPQQQVAVAGLLQAFMQAQDLHAEATGDLSDAELRLLTLQPEAVDAWYGEHPGASLAELHGALAALAARIDLAKNVDAGLVLAAAVERHRTELGPAHGQGPVAPLPGAPDVAGLDKGSPAGPVVPGAWGRLEDALSEMIGPPPEAVPLPSPSRLPPGGVLPAAVTTVLDPILAAQDRHDAAGQTWATLHAVRAAEPTLHAMGAMRRFLVTDDIPPVTPATPVPAEPTMALAGALEAPRPLTDAIESLVRDAQTYDAAVAANVRSLLPGDRDALAAADEVMRLMAAPRWSDAEAEVVAGFFDAAAKVKTPAIAAQQSRLLDSSARLHAVFGQIMTSHESAAQPDPGAMPRMLSTPPAATGPLSDVPLPITCTTTATSDCNRDILYRSSDGAVVITGTGAHKYAPSERGRIVTIDLGGDDVWQGAVGVATTPGLSLFIDLGGNDLYEDDGPLAHGAGLGLGALGILFDADGDDAYRHGSPGAGLSASLAGGGIAYTGAQGFGAAFGVGMLIDGWGQDDYDAPFVEAQGVGAAFGAGTLLDLGDSGPQRMRAQGGQGWAASTGGRGLLVQNEGNTSYIVLLLDETYQGGSAVAGALGVLIDAGGNDTYASDDNGAAQRSVRGNDQLWLDTDRGLGLGLDIAQGDDDGDGFPNVVEVAFGTDAHDDRSHPPALLMGAIDELLFDGDADAYPDLVEAALGTDNGDPASYPAGLPAAAPPSTVPRGGPLITLGVPGANASAAALLIVADVTDDIHTREAHVMIELGGNDTFLGRVGAPSRLLVELDGDDTYDTPGMDGTQGAGNEDGAGLLIELGGHDTYRAASGSQGASCCRLGEAAHRAGAIGLLADFAGDDHYEAGPRSQGYAAQMPVAGLQAETDDPASDPGLVGLLFDAAGDDHYTFATQAFAETLAPIFGVLTGGWGESRIVGSLLDLQGNDVYEASRVYDATMLPTDDEDVGRFFDLQGRARTVSMGQNTGSPIGLFVDGAGLDTYLMLTAGGDLIDVSADKDGQVSASPPPGTQGFPVGLFVDNSAAGAADDDDSDGTINLIEDLLGTNGRDADDQPGSFTRADPDPSAPFLIRAPSPGLILELPGFAIAGTSGHTHDASFPFFIDLGGDDLYVAPGFGGSPGYGANDVRLAIDAGAGNDTYRPQPKVASLQVPGATRFFTTDPNLGGAHTGVAVVADLGGSNTFQSSIDVEAVRTYDGSGASSYTAEAGTWGVAQGAGLLGGVGLLLTWDAASSFGSRVSAVALDEDILPNPTAFAFGQSQGSGWLGVGLLASLGEAGDDAFDARVTAQAPGVTGDRGVAVSASQGVGWGGIGMLVDVAGNNRFESVGGVSQGVGWGQTRFTEAAPLAQGAPQANEVLAAGSAAGILFVGDGDDSFLAEGPAQAAAGAMAPLGNWLTTRAEPTIPGPMPTVHGGIGVALLVNTKGDDTYEASPSPWLQAQYPETVPAFAQGAAVAGSTAVLIDGDGNDRYLARGQLAQGAADGGVAALVDRSGHDRYEAAGRAQGYARDGAVVDASERLCWLHLVICRVGAFGVPAWVPQTENQLVLDAAPSLDSIGLLLDLAGVDHYRVGAYGQGIAIADNRAPVHGAICRSPDDTHAVPGSPAIPDTSPRNRNLAGCPDDGGLAGTDPSRGFIEAEPIGPIARGPLIGALIDGGGTDRYEYDPVPPGKLALRGEGPNDWTWMQTLEAPPEADGFGMPSNPVFGPLDQPPLGAAWDTVHGAGGPDTDEAQIFASLYPTTWPGPTPAFPVIGLGIDQATVAKAFDALGVAYRPATLSLAITSDPEGGEPISGDVVQGQIFVVVAVESQLDVDRVDVFAGARSIGQATRMDDGRFIAAWASDAAGQDPLHPQFPDGVTQLVATARLEAPGTQEAIYAESPARTVQIDNPPALAMRLDRDAISARPYAPAPAPATLQIDLGIDAAFPPGEESEGQPGATLTVKGRDADGGEVILHGPRYHAAQVGLEIPINGSCGASSCPDGVYAIVVEATDAGGLQSSVSRPLTVDSSAPVSNILTPAVAGAGHQAGPARLRVTWQSEDADGGATTTDVFLLSDQGATVLRAGAPGVVTSVETAAVTGAQKRFLTVARDALGNTESPCLEGEVMPCYQAKLAALGDTTVLVDFTPPTMTSVTLNKTHVRTGDALRLEMTGRDGVGESGLLDATVSFAGQSLPMTPAGGAAGRFWFDDWALYSGDLDAAEAEHAFIVTLRDVAENEVGGAASIVLDDLPPRLEALPTRYAETIDGGRLDASSSLAFGRPGAFAEVAVRIEDRGLPTDAQDLVHVDAAPLGVPGEVDLAYDPIREAWVGLLLLPPSLEDGLYHLPLHAEDLAGNVNATPVRVEVEGQPLVLSPVAVEVPGYDSAIVTWVTDRPGDQRVLYGPSRELGLTATGPADLATTHEVRIEGLAPSSIYFAQAISDSRSGVRNVSAIISFVTPSAMSIEVAALPEIAGGPVAIDGRVAVPAALSHNAIKLDLSLVPEDPSLSRIFVATQSQPAGAFTFTLDGIGLPDGRWRPAVTASMPGDRTEWIGDPILLDRSPPALVAVTPGAGDVVPTATPTFVFDIHDASPITLAWLDEVGLQIDGTDHAIANKTLTPAGRLEATLHHPLGDGQHIVRLRLQDAVGNPGAVTFPITVDASGPALAAGADVVQHLRSAPAPAAKVVLPWQDASGVASATIDARPLGLDVLPMVHGAAGWSATMAVPTNVADGRHTLNLTATDIHGAATHLAAALTIVVDNVAPEPVVAATRAGLTSVALDVALNEASRVEIRDADGILAASLGPAAHHTLSVQGLRPGASYPVAIWATDRAGNQAHLDMILWLLGDSQPPTEVTVVAATWRGQLALSWLPATDDAGIDHYEWRDGAVWRPLPGTAGQLRAVVDSGPISEVKVRAVDLAGNAGPAAAFPVTIERLGRQVDIAFDPPVVSADQKTWIIVTYAGIDGVPGDVWVRTGDRDVPLVADQEQSTCLLTCTFRAQITPYTDSAAIAMSIHAADPRFDAAVDHPPILIEPLAEHKAVPAPWTLAILALWFIVRRRR